MSEAEKKFNCRVRAERPKNALRIPARCNPCLLSIWSNGVQAKTYRQQDATAVPERRDRSPAEPLFRARWGQVPTAPMAMTEHRRRAPLAAVRFRRENTLPSARFEKGISSLMKFRHQPTVPDLRFATGGQRRESGRCADASAARSKQRSEIEAI